MPVGTLANIATSAFVRTPPPLAERIVRHLLAFPEGKAVNVLDPTAGEGDLLYPCLSLPGARLFGVEISTARAEMARVCLVGAEVVAAAFEGISLPRESMSLVLCNPPYFFQNGERAEYRIIADSGLLLMPGGIMAAIIPARSAWDGTLINHFCKWYERVQVWKFPDRESADDEAAFEDFTQIVVLGIRRAEPGDLIPAEQRRLSGFRYRASAPKSNPRLRLGWAYGTPPPVLPETPIADPYTVPEARVRPQIVVRHADEASLLAALEKSGAHLSAWWEEASTWEMERLRGQPIMPLSGEAHVAAEVLTGLLDGEILTGPGEGAQAEPHLLTAFVGHEWATMQVDEEERAKLREHGVVSVSVRQWQDKPILGVLNLATGETRYEQGDGVFSFLSPWLGQLAARVATRRVPLYQLDPAEWEMRVLSQFGQDKQLPNAAYAGLSAAQQHRVYALGRSLDLSGRAAIQGEPGVGKTRLAMATAARMAYQWRHRSTPPLLGSAKQPAWMRGLRQAWLKNPGLLAMLGLEAVREAGTGRLIAYRRADSTLLAPEDVGPKALPVLVTTPKKVTKEYAAEIRAAWQEVGAEVMLIESHRDIPQWLARCAESSAPAVVAVFPHSLTRAFGRAWQPAVQEKEILSEVKVTDPDDAVRDRLRPVTDERGKLAGYQWKRTGEWYTRLESATRFYCPDCGGMIKAIPGKLHEVENQPTDEEEGIVLFKKRQVGKLEQEDDRLEPVTSRTWLTLKQRWCDCRSDPRQQGQEKSLEIKPRARTALWTDARLPAAQRKHPQLSFASWSQAVSRVQHQASQRAAQATPEELMQLARQDEAILQHLVTAAHQGAMEKATFATFRPLKNHPAALTKQLDGAWSTVSREPCFFRLLWQTAFPSQKKGKTGEERPVCSLAVAAQPSNAASGEKGKGVKLSAKTRSERMAERRAALEQQRREREGERYITAAPLADSFSPYDYLYRFYKGCVALAIVDESHNGRGRDTDIAHAFHQAMLASQTRMLATGTHFGGDILGFYHYWYRFHPQFWQRLGLGWNDAEKALSQYGVVQEWTKEYESDARRGSGQTNVQVSTIPAPGLSAKLIPYLLEDLVYLAVLDVGAHMPARIEIPEIVSMHDAAIEDAQALAVAKRRDVQAQLATVKRASRDDAMDENERGAQVGRLQRAVEQAMEQEATVRAWAEPRHLAHHYWRLVRRLEDLARERNQAARLAKGTVPRWFAALPCDQPFEVTQTTRDDWGDVIGRQLLIRTESLAWDYLYVRHVGAC